MPRVRIKPGLSHRTLDGLRYGGDVIDVTDAEIASFGDKFEPLADDEKTPHQRIADSVMQVMATGGIVDATDGARELAAEHGIPLVNVKGTGKDGRILISDVSAAIGDKHDS